MLRCRLPSVGAGEVGGEVPTGCTAALSELLQLRLL